MKNVAKRQSKAKGKARLTLISQREIERTYLSKVQEILAMIETEKQSLRDSELRTDEPMHLQIGYSASNTQARPATATRRTPTGCWQGSCFQVRQIG